MATKKEREVTFEGEEIGSRDEENSKGKSNETNSAEPDEAQCAVNGNA